MTQGEGVDATCAVVYMSEGHTALLAKLLIKNKVPCHSERKIPNMMRSTWVIQARKYHRKYGEYGVETTDNAVWSKIHKFKILGNSNNTQKQPSLHDKGDKSTLKELKLNYKKTQWLLWEISPYDFQNHSWQRKESCFCYCLPMSSKLKIFYLGGKIFKTQEDPVKMLCLRSYWTQALSNTQGWGSPWSLQDP